MLEDIRVLDLTDESGWLAGKILGDIGLDVIAVEPPGGHPGRRRPPRVGAAEDPEGSVAWFALGTGRRGITLDLERPRGRELLLRLVETADVLLESAPPGEMAARGLGFEDLRRRNPRLVHCAITPFGQSGPRSEWRGGDLVVVAMGGNMMLTGYPDRPPVRCSNPTAFIHGGPEAALAVLMALAAREEDGRGRFVDVSLHETQLQTHLSYAGQYALHRRMPVREGDRLGGMREIWRARDGYVSFGLRGGPARVANLKATVAWMEECGMAPDWLRDYDFDSYNHNTLSPEELARFEEAFAAFFETRTMRELYDEAVRRRIFLAPCNDAAALLDHPQLRAREFFTEVEHPALGRPVELPGFFARTSEDDVRIRRPAPRVGEHNEEVFGGIGIGPAELRELREEGVV